jgi:hypothetical protein
MRRSKYGYLLLALLVITGLAGTVTSTSITSKERKVIIGYFKDTKTDVLKTVKELSEAQLNYTVANNESSIRDCIFHIAASEKNLWSLIQTALDQPANPERRSEIRWTDKQIINGAIDVEKEIGSKKFYYKYKTVEGALESFKATRVEHIKYMKGTTEDLRNHVVQTTFGFLDCYQLCLVISLLDNKYLQQIEEIKANPNFPHR